jgi:hypothetical protein
MRLGPGGVKGAQGRGGEDEIADPFELKGENSHLGIRILHLAFWGSVTDRTADAGKC